MQQTSEPLVSTLLQAEPGLEDLVAKFVRHLPRLLEELKALHEAGDWQRFRHKIHDLKGMGGNFGFQIVSEVAERIENAAKAGEYGSIPPLLAELDQLYARIQAGQCADVQAPQGLR